MLRARKALPTALLEAAPRSGAHAAGRACAGARGLCRGAGAGERGRSQRGHLCLRSRSLQCSRTRWRWRHTRSFFITYLGLNVVTVRCALKNKSPQWRVVLSALFAVGRGIARSGHWRQASARPLRNRLALQWCFLRAPPLRRSTAFAHPRARVLVFHTGRLVGTGTNSNTAARMAM